MTDLVERTGAMYKLNILADMEIRSISNRDANSVFCKCACGIVRNALTWADNYFTYINTRIQRKALVKIILRHSKIRDYQISIHERSNLKCLSGGLMGVS